MDFLKKKLNRKQNPEPIDGSAAAVVEQKDEAWTCSACTLINEKGNKCSVCGTARGAAAPIASDVAAPPAKKPTPSKALPTRLQITFKASEEKQFQLPELQPHWTIGYLKDIIETKTDILANQQILKVGKNEITNDEEVQLRKAFENYASKPFVVSIETKKPRAVIPSAAPVSSKPAELKVHDIKAQDVGDDWGDAAADWNDEEMEEPVVEEKPSLPRSRSYRILEEEHVLELQSSLLAEIDEVLGVSISDAGVMLRKYRWKKDKLFEDWCKDSAKVLAHCGLLKRKNMEMKDAGELSGELDCPFCVSTVEMRDTLALKCGHRFCKDCWTNWVNAEMEKGPQALYTTCPSEKCSEIIPDGVFASLIDDKKKAVYRKWQIRQFMEGHTSLKWCPNPKCNRAVEYDKGGQKDVECACGHRFCFSCGEEAHQPCSCHLTKRWIDKNKSDSENTQWIMANTKACPKCKVHIEKNQGCNHMTCRNCRYEFCWICSGDWKKHGSSTGGFYQCNVYEKKKNESAEQAVQDAKDNLNRYIHYYSRYENHDKAAKYGLKTLSTIENRMQQVENLAGKPINADFMRDACQAVIQCRRSLKWSYVICYNLKDGSRSKKTFELDQGTLEAMAERLQSMLETFTNEQLTVQANREKIINDTRSITKFLKNLTEGILGGRYAEGLNE